jgi:hypothetical protein
MQPSNEVLAELCKFYRKVDRLDIVACWKNADRHWYGIEPNYLCSEPAELTAARTLFVHSQLDDSSEDRANYLHAMWQLVAPYCRAHS